MNNFLLVMAVVSGISHSAISRLKWTLAKLPKKFKKVRCSLACAEIRIDVQAN